ncbi:MAG: hypothetical protein LBS88_00880, partial [Tannerellaceae bacterium]|nr:hypothetical protein [Tannerellaceae bacterium]
MQFKLSQIQWIPIVLARYEAIHFRRHCEVRSNPLPPSLRGTKKSNLHYLECVTIHKKGGPVVG